MAIMPPTREYSPPIEAPVQTGIEFDLLDLLLVIAEQKKKIILATAIGFLVARLLPALRTVPFRARLAGKLVTTLQLVTLVAVLLMPAAVPYLVGAVGVMSAVSIWDYTLALWRARTAA